MTPVGAVGAEWPRPGLGGELFTSRPWARGLKPLNTSN